MVLSFAIGVCGPAPFALVFGLLASSSVLAASTQAVPWGNMPDGTRVELVTLTNDRGMRVSYVDLGATLTVLEVPDRHGKPGNILLGLPDLAAYQRTRRRFAAVMGRYAGRIGGARFTLDGRTFTLPANANGVALHSDPDGFDRRVWQRKDFSDATSVGSIFSLDSPDGDQGLPGRVTVKVTYRLMRASNEFRIDYEAETTAPTVLNLTNHAFFNLAGAGTAGLGTHRFQIDADRFAETDAKRVPTGTFSSVNGTPLDFRKPASIASRLAIASPWLGDPPGFDHSLLFSGADGTLRLMATIDESTSGRRMQVLTTEPSVQFNSGNGFDGTEMGAEGRAYLRHDGFAFETQHLPDSPNHAHFPTAVVRPGTPFRSTTIFRFSTVPSKH
jgi:aldose 1-epimerase